VLDALAGYMAVAERLLDGDREAATAFNFGPSEDDTQPVGWVVERMLEHWGASGWKRPQGEQPHEAVLLKLDSSKARNELGWRPALRLNEALAMVVHWHREVLNAGDARRISISQLEDFTNVTNGTPNRQAHAA
jgi:CDP-glucose 4,6-dehydratase